MALKKSSLSLTELLEENLVSEIFDLYSLSKTAHQFQKKNKALSCTSNQVKMFVLLSNKLCEINFTYIL